MKVNDKLSLSRERLEKEPLIGLKAKLMRILTNGVGKRLKRAMLVIIKKNKISSVK